MGKLWEKPIADPKLDPEGYAAEFRARYGLAPAPYPNDGLPMGLRKGNGPGGTKVGVAIDCMACHGGSIGGTSYVGLGNTQLDMKRLFHEMLRAEGKPILPSTFEINSSRGTVNAGMFSVVLLSLRNPDLSFRTVPDAHSARTSPSWTSPPGGSSARSRPCITTAGPTPGRSGPTCNSCSARRPSTNSRSWSRPSATSRRISRA